MNLEEIITAAVEKRITELVDAAIQRNTDRYRHPDDDMPNTRIEQRLDDMIRVIAATELEKHSDRIRAAIITALEAPGFGIELSAYVKIKVPSK